MVRGLTVTFGGVVAVDDIDLDLREGGILAVVGPNGAGKSTVLNAVSGVVRRRASVLESDGRDLRSLSPARIARLGFGRGFQHPRLLASRTVVQNLVLAGIAAQGGAGMLRRLVAYRSTSRLDGNMEARARELAERLGLTPYLSAAAGSVAYGVQKKIDLARALMLRPRVLLLDEPFSGLGPADADAIAEELATMPGQECDCVLLVEHNLRLVRRVAHRVIALETGRVLVEGPTEEVMSSREFVDTLQGMGVTRGLEVPASTGMSEP